LILAAARIIKVVRPHHRRAGGSCGSFTAEAAAGAGYLINKAKQK